MELICKLKDLYKVLYTYEKFFSEGTGLTINEAALLCCLKDGIPKSANELCHFIGLSGSRVSRIIPSMERKGFISREMGSSDKRQMIFSLTESGKKKASDMQSHKIDLSELLQQINPVIEELNTSIKK